MTKSRSVWSLSPIWPGFECQRKFLKGTFSKGGYGWRPVYWLGTPRPHLQPVWRWPSLVGALGRINAAAATGLAVAKGARMKAAPKRKARIPCSTIGTRVRTKKRPHATFVGFEASLGGGKCLDHPCMGDRWGEPSGDFFPRDGFSSHLYPERRRTLESMLAKIK